MKYTQSSDFLLSSATAQTLYFEVLRDMPIFDYHCHISAKEIFENKKYSDIGELWLKYDHYKWRAMRSCGLKEKFITGDETSNLEKFRAWAGVLPKCMGNVLYNWSQLELLRCFGIDEMLDENNADDIWTDINRQLKQEEFCPRNLLTRAKVTYLSTTDDPTDSLDYHNKLSDEKDFPVKITPTWRPDIVLDIGQVDYAAYIADLEESSGIGIDGFETLKKALSNRMDYFMHLGCLSSDHSLKIIPYSPASCAKLEEIFNKRMSGQVLSRDEEENYRTELLTFLAREYAKRGWVMQLHIGAMRNNNRRMFEKLGPNSGFDSIDDFPIAAPLSKFLDRLDYANQLPKTVIFAINPKDYYVIGSMIGNYQTDEIPGKIQFGAAWWFNDHIEGIRKHIKDLANLAVLSHYIGMVTDSRCMLSYFSRHEIFRRIICDVIGSWVENGYYPNDSGRLKNTVQDISFNNAKVYFGH